MTHSEATSQELANLDAQGSPPESRLTTPRAARQIYERLKEEDRDASLNRARIQAMIDGEPPYNAAELKRTGQGFRTNINFGEAEAMVEDALVAYTDLTMGGEFLVSVETDYDAADDEKVHYNQVLSREISNVFKQWRGYTSNSLKNARYFVTEGVSVVYWENEKDWRWKVSKFGDFKIPRNSSSDTDELEIAFCRREIAPHELFRFIKNPKAATAKGWDVEAVRQVLIQNTPGNDHSTTHDWERWQERAKECDLAMTSLSEKIGIVHIWVQEYDGQVSHFIILESGSNTTAFSDMKPADEGDKFLFKKIRRFASMTNAFVFYTYGVGSNGNLHTVRGLGYKIFPHIQISNRMHCQLADGSMISSAAMVQPTSQSSKVNMGMTFMGPYTVISPDMQYVNQTPPNYSQNLIPAVQHFGNMMQRRGGQYSANNVLPQKGEMTRGEVDARISGASTVSSVNIQLYYEPEDWKFRETIRRMKDPSYGDEPRWGGQYLKDMKDALEAQGVPIEAFYKINLNRVRAVRVAGAGSKELRGRIFDQLTQMAGTFDPTGRVNLYRDRMAALLGDYTMVDRYLPKPEENRKSIDSKIAELENYHMIELKQVQVHENELHLEHIPVHVAKINEFLEAAREGAPLEEITEPLVLLHGHTVTHLDLAQGDPFSSEEINHFRQILQQAGEIILNGTRRLEAMARDRQAAGEESAGADGEKGARLQRDLLEHQAKLSMLQEKHQQELQHRQEKAALDRQLADAEAAAKINRSAAAQTN